MLITTLLFAAVVVLSQTPNMEQLRWHNRVVLLFTSDPSSPGMQKQQQMLEGAEKDLAERDVKVYEVTGSSAQEAALRLQFGVEKLSFAVVLVGKDGGRKLRKTKPVEPSELFALIDSMPMRKAEISRRTPQ